jgi:transglutaminase-like putative cysteine protease
MKNLKWGSLTIISCLLLVLSTAAGCSLLPTATTTVTTTAAKTTTIPATTSAVMSPTTSTVTTTAVPAEVYSNPVTYRVLRTITVKNDSAGIDVLRIWLPAATEWESQRNVVFGQTQPVTGSFWIDTQNNTRGMYIEVPGSPAAGSTLVITDEFNFTSYEIHYHIDPAQIGPYDTADPQCILYTQPEKYFIQSGDPGIAATAAKLKSNSTNPYEIAKSYNDWVKEHMTYQLVKGLKGAKFAYDNGYGECGDYSCLFVALCRASGIPARPVVGRWARSVKNDWHVWAEFFLPGYGWVPADPTVEDSSGGNYFGHLDNQRLIFNKQTYVVLDPAPQFFPGVCGILQTWLWEYRGATGTISVDLDYDIRQVNGK